jgi:ketopantoate reductase
LGCVWLEGSREQDQLVRQFLYKNLIIGTNSFDAIRHGLELETQNGDVKLISGLKATTDPNECISDGKKLADLALVMVKSTHTRDAATNAKILLGDEKGFALTLQNGLGNREILVDALGEHRVLQGVTNHGAMAVEPGRVKHTGVGPTLLASAAAEPITAHLIEASAACTFSRLLRMHL